MPATIPALLLLLAALQSDKSLVIAQDCPLNFSWGNLTLIASSCSNQMDRAKCCRYINAFIAVSIAHYANAAGGGTLGVPLALLDECLNSVSEVLRSSGVSANATVACGLGTKIQFLYQCQGRETILEMLQSPNFNDVSENCKMLLSSESSCRRCLNSAIIYLHRLVGAGDNVTLNSCRDAAFIALTNHADTFSAIAMASCFFTVEPLGILPEPSSQALVPEASPSPFSAQAPIQQLTGIMPHQHQHRYKLTLIPAIGIAVIVLATLLLGIVLILIRRKSRELDNADTTIQDTVSSISPHPLKPEGGQPITFRRYSYKEVRKATNNFSSVVGRSRDGIVYKAKFNDGSLAAVERINEILEQSEEEFCRDVELLGRLHHRHVVALKGFCVEGHKRMLIYECMEYGSLKDRLYSPNLAPLRWQVRIRIAIDVANALEYLHFYCDPPHCHGDIKSSNVLLDEHYIAKVADFSVEHTPSNGGSISESDSAGYLDPEFSVTRQLTDKSDIYSYGVLLLELLTGRKATQQDGQNLVDWSQRFIARESMLPILLDPAIADSLDLDQLQELVKIIRLCTQREGKARPSIKAVIKMFYEGLDPGYSGFIQLMKEEGLCCRGENQADEISNGDPRHLHSSSSTSRSYCSRSILLDGGSPQSPHGVL